MVQADKFLDVYNYLRDEAKSSKAKVFIFVANDIDSICTLHILQACSSSSNNSKIIYVELFFNILTFEMQELLKEDHIPYSYRPVSSYEEMYQVRHSYY